MNKIIFLLIIVFVIIVIIIAITNMMLGNRQIESAGYVIFPASYDTKQQELISGTSSTAYIPYKSWTVTRDDINQIEPIIKTCLAEKEPAIRSKIGQYKRQYFGLVNNKGEKLIWTNFFNDKIKYWKRDIVHVSDGGDNYFSLKIDYQTFQCQDIQVNGQA